MADAFDVIMVIADKYLQELINERGKSIYVSAILIFKFVDSRFIHSVKGI